jgi:hypothetical protein
VESTVLMLSRQREDWAWRREVEAESRWFRHNRYNAAALPDGAPGEPRRYQLTGGREQGYAIVRAGSNVPFHSV